jgi:anti-sigma regulatory factor (Ser/Thr protein kinase)
VGQLTPQRVDDELRRLSRRLEAKADELAELAGAAAEADVAYKVEHAKALLRSALKTVAEREAEATILTERLLRDKRTKEAVAEACKEACRATRDQLSACQSIASNLRAEMGFSGRGAA